MDFTRRRVGVIGAGFTGTMLAIQLAERLGDAAEIVLIDRDDAFGRGIAFAAGNDCHVLNVAAGNMGAYDGDPAHFLEWLKQAGFPGEKGSFLRRGLYGSYLRDLLERYPGITRLTGEVRKIEVDGQGAVLRFTHGPRIRVDQAALCIGNLPPASPVERRIARACHPRFLANPWQTGGLAAVGEQETVVLVGTGLTMVDVTLDLQSRGHRGTVTALSRHGLLPTAHRPSAPLERAVDWQQVPASALALLRSIRATIKDGNWRSVIDSLRPHTQALWQRLPLAERRRFMRHLKPYWEIHRHRLAPEVAERLERLKVEGRLAVVAGRVREVVAGPAGIRVMVRERGQKGVHAIEAGWIVNCSGPALDYEGAGDPLLRSLFKAGRLRPGPLALGLDVDSEFRLIDANGLPSPRLFAIGPPLRGVLWETTAVPDIRRQCAELAETIARTPHEVGRPGAGSACL